MTSEPPQIDPTGPRYVYEQVADWIEARVASGDLEPGHKLPAERDLAEQVGVSYMSVRRAMKLLRDRGVIETVVGKGTFIARRG